MKSIQHILMALMCMVAPLALACQGSTRVSAGGYAATSAAALQESVLAVRRAANDPKKYRGWFERMAADGHMVFVSRGTRICITDKKDGVIRASIQGRPLYMSAYAVAQEL